MKTLFKKQHLGALLLINIAIIAVVFFAFSKAGQHEIITLKLAKMNVRSGPGLDYEVAGEIERGERLTVLKEENKWLKVRTSDRLTGWVAGWIVTQSDEIPESKLIAKVNTQNTKLRKKANTESDELDSLIKGTKVTVNDERNGWSQITVDKQKGWIFSELLTPIDPDAETDNKAVDQLLAQENDTKIRKEPNVDGEVIATVNAGDNLTFKEREGEWYEVETVDNQIGYVASWVVEFDDKKDIKNISSVAEATIVLDPGHGGSDVGAQSNDGTISEKIVTLATANYVKKELEKLGANVILTRSDDSFISLSDIAIASNRVKADVFISFHYDSTEMSNQASGFTSYYYNDSYEKLAETLSTHLEESIPLPNRGVEQGDYQVLRENERPAILLELGYMNNDFDSHTFKTKKFQRQVARAVASALIEYFEE